MRIEGLLRRLFRPAPAPEPQARDALEADLMRSFPGQMRPRRRWLIGVGIGAAALVGACVAPAEYELKLGHRITITMDTPPESFDPQAISEHIERNFEVEQMRVMVQMSKRDDEEGPRLQMVMDMVGKADVVAVEASMVDAFPVLGDADMDVEPIDGTVHGTFGGFLSERALGVRIDRESVEETRARILEELAARGIEGTATVEIEDEQTADGHRREVRVRVEAEQELP